MISFGRLASGGENFTDRCFDYAAWRREDGGAKKKPPLVTGAK